MPFSCCNMNNCDYASRNDKSYWLSTNASIPGDSILMGSEIRQHISRCVVCEASTPTITLHSQSGEDPPCPYNWKNLWSGYSFLMVRNAKYQHKDFKHLMLMLYCASLYILNHMMQPHFFVPAYRIRGRGRRTVSDINRKLFKGLPQSTVRGVPRFTWHVPIFSHLLQFLADSSEHAEL